MAKAVSLPDPASIRALINDKGLLQVYVTPNAQRSEVRLPENNDDPTLHVRTTATPEDGKANEAVVKLVAKALGIAKSKILLERGATSRIKILKLVC